MASTVPKYPIEYIGMASVSVAIFEKQTGSWDVRDELASTQPTRGKAEKKERVERNGSAREPHFGYGETFGSFEAICAERFQNIIVGAFSLLLKN